MFLQVPEQVMVYSRKESVHRGRFHKTARMAEDARQATAPGRLRRQKINRRNLTPQTTVITSIKKISDSVNADWEDWSQQAREILRRAFSATTIKMRKSLVRRLSEFARDNARTTVDETATEFVANCNVSPQSKLAYGLTMQALLRAHSFQTPTLETLLRGLRAMGAGIPLKQAPPANRSQVKHLKEAIGGKIGLGIWLAWKTASRWSDLRTLTKESFLFLSNKSMVIKWGAVKNNRLFKFKATNYSEVKDRSSMRWAVEMVQALKPKQKLVRIKTPDLTAKIRKYYPELSAHSFKRGAIQELFRLASKNKVPLSKIPLIAKHQDPKMNIPSSTIRYAGESAELGKALGSGKVTMLL